MSYLCTVRVSVCARLKSIRCLQECVLPDVQSALYMQSIRMRGCVQRGDVWYVIHWCSTVLSASCPAPLHSRAVTSPALICTTHVAPCTPARWGRKKILSSSKNVKQMFVKRSYNEFMCKCRRFLFTFMGHLCFPRGVARLDKKSLPLMWMLLP